MAAPPGPDPKNEIRGLHLLYMKEVAAASSLAASPAAAAAAAAASSLAASPAAAAAAAAAPAGGAAPDPAASLGGAADPPELYVGKDIYVGEDNKLYGIDGTQLVRINVDARNLVRVADAAAHSEKKDADEDVITGKEYKSAESAAVRHARKALTTLEERFPIIKNIGDLREKIEDCCKGIGAAPGGGAGAAARLEGAAGAEVALRLEIEDLRRQLGAALAASAGAAPPGDPAAGAVDVIKLLTYEMNHYMFVTIFNLYGEIKTKLLIIFNIVKRLKNRNDVIIDVQRKPFNDANKLLPDLNDYLHVCIGKLGIGHRLINGNEEFEKLLYKLDKSIELGLLFNKACREFMDVINAMLNKNDYHYFDTLEPQFSAAMNLHDEYIKNNYEDNSVLTYDAVNAAYMAIKYEEEGGDGGEEEEYKEGEEEGGGGGGGGGGEESKHIWKKLVDELLDIEGSNDDVEYKSLLDNFKVLLNAYIISNINEGCEDPVTDKYEDMLKDVNLKLFDNDTKNLKEKLEEIYEMTRKLYKKEINPKTNRVMSQSDIYSAIMGGDTDDQGYISNVFAKLITEGHCKKVEDDETLEELKNKIIAGQTWDTLRQPVMKYIKHKLDGLCRKYILPGDLHDLYVGVRTQGVRNVLLDIETKVKANEDHDSIIKSIQLCIQKAHSLLVADGICDAAGGAPPAGGISPRKTRQSGGLRNRRVTPIGKKIGGISIKKRTPKKKSRSKK